MPLRPMYLPKVLRPPVESADLKITKLSDAFGGHGDRQDTDESWDTDMNANVRSTLPMLEPFYYLKNFELVLSTVLVRYADLLAVDELRFITEFPQVPQSSRALLARMVMRRGDLFRASKLNYPEIGDTRAAAAALIEAGWVTDRPMLHIGKLQSVLTKAELIRSLALPRRYAAWRKPDLVAKLNVQFAESREFADWCRGAADCVYALLVAPICERFRLMFFGNYRQSWSEFVTADLKIFNYEKVERSLHSRAFQTRAQIDAFQRLQECSDWLQDGMPLDELVQFVPPVIVDSEWLEDRRQGCCSSSPASTSAPVSSTGLWRCTWTARIGALALVQSGSNRALMIGKRLAHFVFGRKRNQRAKQSFNMSGECCLGRIVNSVCVVTVTTHLRQFLNLNSSWPGSLSRRAQETEEPRSAPYLIG